MPRSSLERSITRTALAATGLLLIAAPSLAAAAIVVASSGPSARDYPAGRKLDDNARITLRAGDTVTVLDRKGTRVLRGAGTFALNGAGVSAPNPTFALFTRPMAASRVRTGSVRGAPEQDPGARTQSPNLWYVDTARSGPHCYVDASAVSLWRGVSGSAERYTVKEEKSAASAPVAFAAGGQVAAWDASRLAIKPGATYTITGANGSASRVKFVQLANMPDSPENLAAALIDKGCKDQLELLSTTLARR